MLDSYTKQLFIQTERTASAVLFHFIIHGTLYDQPQPLARFLREFCDEHYRLCMSLVMRKLQKPPEKYINLVEHAVDLSDCLPAFFSEPHAVAELLMHQPRAGKTLQHLAHARTGNSEMAGYIHTANRFVLLHQLFDGDKIFYLSCAALHILLLGELFVGIDQVPVALEIDCAGDHGQGN